MATMTHSLTLTSLALKSSLAGYVGDIFVGDIVKGGIGRYWWGDS